MEFNSGLKGLNTFRVYIFQAYTVPETNRSLSHSVEYTLQFIHTFVTCKQRIYTGLSINTNKMQFCNKIYYSKVY